MPRLRSLARYLPAQRQTRLNILRCRLRRNGSLRILCCREKAHRSASAIFCCSSSFNSLRRVMWVGMSPSRSAGMRGVAASSASKGQSRFIPKTGRPPQKILDCLAAKTLINPPIVHSLIFETHAVLDGPGLTFSDKLCALPHRICEWLFGHERINQAAAECFGCPLQRVQCDGAVSLGLLKPNDRGLGQAEAAAHLSRSHAKRVSDGAQPSLRRTGTPGQWTKSRETLIKMANGVFHVIGYRLLEWL